MLAYQEQGAYNSSMKSSYVYPMYIRTLLCTPTTETHMSNPFTDPLTHSGKMMLSGMNVKPASVTEAEVQAFLDAGNEIKVIKAKSVKRHNAKSKSHSFWGDKS